MSIINEALKKAGQNLQKKSAADNNPPQKPGGSKTILLYILILAAGLFLANFIFSLLKHSAGSGKSRPAASGRNQNKNRLPAVTAKPAPIAPAETTPALSPVLPEPTPQENKLAATDFILSGIFVSGDDAYALTNNRIVRVNDYVGGAKVSTITENAVELENAAGKITLTTSR